MLEPERVMQVRQVFGRAVRHARVQLVQLEEGVSHGVDVGEREEDDTGEVTALGLGALSEDGVARGCGAAAAVDNQDRALLRAGHADGRDDRLVRRRAPLTQPRQRLRGSAERGAILRVAPREGGHAPS